MTTFQIIATAPGREGFLVATTDLDMRTRYGISLDGGTASVFATRRRAELTARLAAGAFDSLTIVPVEKA